MRQQTLRQYLAFTICLLSAYSLDHEKSFLYQDGASIVVAIALYKDSLLLTASNDIVQKDIETGIIQRTFRAHERTVYAFTLTNDSRLITSGFDDMIMVWDLDTGSILKRIWLRASDTRINSLQVQDDLVIAGGSDNKVRLVDLVSGKVMRTIQQEGYIHSVVVREDYFYIAKQIHPYVLRLSITGGSANLVYAGHIDTVYSLYLSENILVSGSHDTTVRCWNANTAAVVHVLNGHMGYIRAVAIFDGHVYSAGKEHFVIKWSLQDGSIVKMFPDIHKSDIMCLAFGDSQLFTGAIDTFVIRWDAVSGESLFTYRGRNKKLRAVVAWKHFIISGGEDLAIKVWDASMNGIEPSFVLRNHTRSINCLLIYEDLVFSGSSDVTVKRWNITQLTLEKSYEGPTNAILSIAVDREFVYSAGFDQDIFQWDVSTGFISGRFAGHTFIINSILLDSVYLYSGSEDRLIRIWDVNTHESLKEIESFDEVTAILLQETMIIACSVNGIQSFSIVTGQNIVYLNEFIICGCIISLGDRAYTGHPDGVIRTRDLYSLSIIETYQGHLDYVFSLCFDDAYNLYSTGFDGSIKKWNMVTRQVAYSFERRLSSVTSLVAVGELLFVGTEGGSIFSYNIDTASTLKTLTYFNQSVSSLLTVNSSVYASSLDGLMLKFSTVTQTRESIVFNSIAEPIRSLAFNNKYLVSLLGETKAAIFSNNTIKKTLDFPTAMVCIAASEKFLLGGSRSGVIFSWNLEFFEFTFELKGHIAQVNSLLVVGETLFSASGDKSIIEWSLKDAIMINTYKRLSASVLGHLGPVNALSYCFNSLFSAGSDLSVRRWNTNSGKHQEAYFGFSKPVTTVICNNGSVFAGSEDFAVLMYRPVFDHFFPVKTSFKATFSTNKKRVSRVFAKSRLLQSGNISTLSLVLGVSGVVALLVGLGGAYFCVKFYRKPTADNTPSKTQDDISLTITDLKTIVNSIVGISKHAEFLIPSSTIAGSKKLASGGGGELFIAKVMDPSLQKKAGDTVIQKVVFTKTKSHEEAFFQEVGIMIMLSTFPHFCKIIGYTESPLSMILKFYPNGSLHEWLSNHQTFGRFSFKLLKELAAALNTMHSHYLAHCDIKPQNILMEIHNGIPSCFLTDFGITQILSEEILASRMFKITNLRGLSIHYASPEAFSNFRSKRYINVDFKKYDLYSYGCIIYDFVTSRSPWRR